MPPPSTPSAPDFSSTPFTHLILGGGTTGLTIAARLSANLSLTIGVLEAGPAAFGDPVIDVPGRFGEALGGRYDWGFETVGQVGLGGRRLGWPRGKVLGGTSAVNFMTWNRGGREDFGGWRELGVEGWGWDELLPYFKKTETLHASSPEHQTEHHSYHTPEYHGTDGPVSTTYSKDYSVPHRYWHATLEKLGLETNKSHFSGTNRGAFTTLTSVYPHTRTRCYSASAYYLPNTSRKNLIVLTEALVKEIILEKKGPDEQWTAKGVKFSHGNQEHIVKVSHEVILSCGSVQSPQLLELSGIGCPPILEAAGITCKVESQMVGENLQEHMMTAMAYEIDPAIIGPDELRANAELAKAEEEAYRTSQSGIYAMLPCALSYASAQDVLSESQLQNIRERTAHCFSKRDQIIAKQFDPDVKRGQIEYLFDVGNWSTYYESEPGKVYGTMLMMLQLPFSKGTIHIPPKSSKGAPTMDDKPIIDPEYFAGPGGKIDFEIMTAAQKFAHKICSTAPLSNIIRKRAFPPEAGSTGDEEDCTDFVRNYTVTDWHPIGTCAMGGSAGVEGGVVDERLRVYGVKGLRVADASIMPLHICAHPQATIYAIGEKAAAMILDDYEASVRSQGEGRPSYTLI